MELIEVQYVEESSKAIFFNVKFKTNDTFWKEGKVITKRAFLEKWEVPGFGKYANNFQWTDGLRNCDQYNSAFIEEMILKYEQRKKQ